MTDLQEQPSAELDAAIARNVAAGARLEFQGDREAILVFGHRPSHALHLILTILTLGLWGIFVWLPICLFGGEKRRVLRLDDAGHVRASRH